MKASTVSSLVVFEMKRAAMENNWSMSSCVCARSEGNPLRSCRGCGNAQEAKDDVVIVLGATVVGLDVNMPLAKVHADVSGLVEHVATHFHGRGPRCAAISVAN